tara:strand:- start:6248 stop:6850 length:603 start_codon:yes stop_codon:yes gene_type:complete
VLFQIFADLYANEQQDEKGPGAKEKKIDADGIHKDLPCHASNSRTMSPLYDGRNCTKFPACRRAEETKRKARMTSGQFSQNPRATEVALKAYRNIADNWALPARQAAALADMSPGKWRGARRPNYRGRINVDQMLRLSALIGIYRSLELYFNTPIARSWILLPNQGPLFLGAKPLDVMIADGLPALLTTRQYLDNCLDGQ